MNPSDNLVLARNLLGAASADGSTRPACLAELNRLEAERPGELVIALLCLAYRSSEDVLPEARFLAVQLCRRAWERSGPAALVLQRQEFLRQLAEIAEQRVKLTTQGGPLASYLPLLLRCSLSPKSGKGDWGEHLPKLLNALLDTLVGKSLEAGPLLHGALKALEKHREKEMRPMMAALLQKLAPCWGAEAGSTDWTRMRYLDGCGLLLAELAPEVIETASGEIGSLLITRANCLLQGLQTNVHDSYFTKNIRALWKGWGRLIKSRPQIMLRPEAAQLAVRTLQSCISAGRLKDPGCVAISDFDSAARYCIRVLQLSVKFSPDSFEQHVGDVMDLLCSCMRIEEDELEAEDIAGGGRDGGDAETLRSVVEQTFKSLLTPKCSWAASLRSRLFGGGSDDVALVCVADFPELFPDFNIVALLGACQLAPPINAMRLTRLCAAVEAKVLQEGGNAKLGPSIADALELLLKVVEAPMGSQGPDSVPFPARLAALDACRVVVEMKAKKATPQERDRIASQKVRLLNAALALLPCLQTPEGQWRCLRVVQAEGNEDGGVPAARGLLQVWRQASGETLISQRLAVLDVLLTLLRASASQPPPVGIKRNKMASAPNAIESQVKPPILSAGLFECCTHVIQEAFSIRELHERGQLLLLGMMRTGEPSNLLALCRRVVLLEANEADATTVPRTTRWDLLAEAIALSRRCSDHELLNLCLKALLSILQRTDLMANVSLGSGASSEDPLQQRLLRALHLFLLSPTPPEAFGALPGLVLRFVEGRVDATGFLPLVCTWQMHHAEHFMAHAPVTLVKPILEHVLVFKTARVRWTLLGTALALIQRGGIEQGIILALLQELLSRCNDLLALKETKVKCLKSDGTFLLPGLATAAGQLPAPWRVTEMLEYALIPNGLQSSCSTWAGQAQPGLAADGAIEDWFFANLTSYLRDLGPAAQELTRNTPVTVIRRLQLGA